MASDRDQLAAILRGHSMPSGEPDFPADEYECCADAVIAAGWRPPTRVITTVDDLDALPVAAVILAGGQAWQGIRTPVGPLWRLAGGAFDRSSEYVLCMFGPATVLFTPTERTGE